MPTRSSFPFLLAAAALALAGCANQPKAVSWGKYLVYRDAAGAPTMQIDYPSESFCRQVESVASRNAKCEPDSTAARLQARATLWYNPPDLMVEAHYADLANCQKANSQMAQGVHLEKPCTAK
ncbi:hypothetical protein [Ramlibacter sp.]|uniref:hypothetical protein n=1 Tax=Ramlibacter sp. TaxID=1917967 RepID=UPI002C64F387|nr:hypothetical protein [Ramlibacter sp.]HWI80771.1 hypothetical protein [Ramlibacter sp.]